MDLITKFVSKTKRFYVSLLLFYLHLLLSFFVQDSEKLEGPHKPQALRIQLLTKNQAT